MTPLVTPPDPRAPCAEPNHGPTCEGYELHIRARDAKGCAQMQDGSWITKAYFACQGPHPGLPGKRRPDYGEAEAMLDWLAANGIGDGS